MYVLCGGSGLHLVCIPKVHLLNQHVIALLAQVLQEINKFLQATCVENAMASQGARALWALCS